MGNESVVKKIFPEINTRFEVDPQDGVEFYERWTGKAQVEPEIRLAMAVLTDACEDLQKTPGSERHKEALKWFLGETVDKYNFFSDFDVVCAIIGVNPDWVRRLAGIKK